MKFTCSFCQKKGEVGTVMNPNKDFFLSRWYRDDNGYNHEIIVCNECGTIHDVQFSFFKLFSSWLFKTAPYKTKGFTDLMSLASAISDIAKQFQFNAREVAYYEFGLNEPTIDHMINKNFFGKAFTEKLAISRDDYIARKLLGDEKPHQEEINLRNLLKKDFGIDFPISGGTGNSRDNPIVVHKVEPNDYTSVEYGILRCLGEGRRVEWKVLQQAVLHGVTPIS